MNHAEEADPLPPCRGSIKGDPARGGKMYRSFIRWALIVGSALVSVSIGLLIEGNFEQVLKYWNQLAPYVLTMFLGVSLVVASSFFSYLYRVSKRIDIVKTEIISKDENLIALKGDINKAWQELKAMKAAVAQAKAEQEQYRQEKAALQAELEKTRAELEKARQAEGVNPRSRNTYLKVIAALANRNGKVDLHERGAAVTISRATENFGFPVSEDTTRKIIKEIEELQK